MKKDLRVAIIQAKVPKSKDEGEIQVARLVKEATKEPIDMVGLPEDCIATYAEIKSGYNALKFLSSIAKENKIYLFGATAVLEKDGLHNRGFFFNKSGKLVAWQDKVSLTPPEKELGIIAGRSLKVFETEFGKMAILICRDSFFRYAAWFYEKLWRAGAEIILVPSLSLDINETAVEMWASCLKALAKWFSVYILAPGTVGPNSTPYNSHGHALIICPKRLVLAEGSYEKEEILRATLDKKSIEEIRKFPGPKWQPANPPRLRLITP